MTPYKSKFSEDKTKLHEVNERPLYIEFDKLISKALDDTFTPLTIASTLLDALGNYEEVYIEVKRQI